MNNAKIIKLRVRGTNKDLSEDTSSEEVCVVMRATVARFDGSDIQVYANKSAFCSYLVYWTSSVVQKTCFVEERIDLLKCFILFKC